MTSESSERHHRAADARGPVPIAVVTVSDSRTEETDTNGRWLRDAITAAGHEAAGYRVIRDEPDLVSKACVKPGIRRESSSIPFLLSSSSRWGYSRQ